MKKIETIYLAAALRDKGGGRIEAGLIDLVAIREGDALQTLADGLPESFDLAFVRQRQRPLRGHTQAGRGFLAPRLARAR